MKKKVNRLKAYIRRCLPYRVHRNICIGFLFLSCLCVLLCVYFLSYKPDPIPYDETNITDYMYLHVDAIYPAVDHYYFVEYNDYIHVYYNEDPIDITQVKQIRGIPWYLEQSELEKIFYAFQKRYPDLENKTIDQMTDYIGYYSLDGSVIPSLSYFGVAMVFSFAFFFAALFILIGHLFFINRYRSSLKLVVDRNEHELIIQQLHNPTYHYSYINVMLLEHYFVVNHPSPFVIDYRDIAWIYIEKKSFLYSMDQNLRIIMYDKSLTKRKIWFGSSLLKKNVAEIEALFDQLPQMNPNMMIGYNEENIQKFKEMKKEVL